MVSAPVIVVILAMDSFVQVGACSIIFKFTVEVTANR
jgi:hypothetical protein